MKSGPGVMAAHEAAANVVYKQTDFSCHNTGNEIDVMNVPINSV